MNPEPFLEFRDALHAALGFRSHIPTATFEQLVAVAKATAKRADDAEQELARVHEALDEAGVPGVSGSAELRAVDRVRLLAAELDAYAPKPATRDTTALRELLDGLEADAVRAHHPVSAASVRAVRVLVGVSDG